MNSKFKKFKLKNFNSSLSSDKRSLCPINRLYKRALLGYNRCGTKNTIKATTRLKNKLKAIKTTNNW